MQVLWRVFCVAIYAAVYFFAIDKIYGLLQTAVVLAIPVIILYNGQRGSNEKISKIMKWVFCICYPDHLFIIGLIQLAG